ncbi:MFS general substrate transporter [Backusella circina FSU 941]|nr:MFS general substrate transporter [Backusella circina FSU 941]
MSSSSKGTGDEEVIQSKDVSEKLSVEMLDAEKKYVRKLDYVYVLPFVFTISFLQYIDKTALNYASVLGIISDTKMTNNEYGFAGSIFFLGFFLAQAPTGLLIQKIPVGKCLGILTITWGCVLAATSQVKKFSHLVALRFILGLFEGGVYPCCIMLLSRMYRRREQPQRFAFINFGNGLALSFGGFIGYGVGHMVDIGGLRSWQWLMIMLGAITVFFGLCCFFFLADDPKSKLLRLTEEEENIADLRTLDNAVTISRNINYKHILESLKEPRYYCYIIAGLLANLQNGSMMTFSAIITSNLGYSNLNAILISVPSGVTLMIASAVGVMYVSSRGHLHDVVCINFFIAILGIVLLLTLPVYKAKVVGLYLWWANATGLVLFFAGIGANVSGYTKKIFYSSSLNACYCLGSFIGPQLMFDSQKPLYLGAMVTYICCDIIAIILVQFASYSMKKANSKKKDYYTGSPGEAGKDKDDLTDQNDPNFLYKI